MTYLTIPLFLILELAPATLPAQREICVEMKSADWNFPAELVINIPNAPALFKAFGKELVISPDNYIQSHFEGTAEEMVREYCE